MKRLECDNPLYTEMVRWCLEDILKMEDYRIKISFGNFQLFRGRNNFYGKHSRRNSIAISLIEETDTHNIFKKRRTNVIIKTIFHELRHYYQDCNKMFPNYIQYTSAKWYRKYSEKEKVNIFTKWYKEWYKKYMNLPWEIDARNFEEETYKLWTRKQQRKI